MNLLPGSRRAITALVLLLALGALVRAAGQQGSAAAETKGSAPASNAGSDACKACHKDLASGWAANPHAKTLAAEGLPDSLKGCEVCHGPGSLHVAEPTKAKLASLQNAPLKGVAQICGKCHFEGGPGAVVGKTMQPKYWRRSEHNQGGVSCLACHTVHLQSPGLLTKRAPELCVGCHQDVAKNGGYQHAPVAGGACLSCHDPHGTNSRHQLVSDLPKVCLSCHSAAVAKFGAAHHGYDVSASNCTECHAAHSRRKSDKLLKTTRHGPFKAGQCETCHEAGSLDLVKPERELCTSCHSKDLAAAPADGSSVHAPVQEGMCTVCHSPHASDAPKALLRDKTPAYACFLCHSSVETEVNSDYTHKPAGDLNCLACHTPHVSKEKNMLVKDSIELCKGCHQPHLHPLGKTPEGKVVIDPTTKEMLTCASCHTPHGSDFDQLTKKDKKADLCRMCHKAMKR